MTKYVIVHFYFASRDEESAQLQRASVAAFIHVGKVVSFGVVLNLCCCALIPSNSCSKACLVQIVHSMVVRPADGTNIIFLKSRFVAQGMANIRQR